MNTSNSKNLFLVGLFFLILLCTFVFMANPYHILDRFKLTVLFLFFVLIFGTFYFIESHFKEDTSEPFPVSLTFFLYHFLRVGKFLLFAALLTWAFVLFYGQFVQTTRYMLEMSFFLTLGFVILLLAVLYRGDTAPLNSPVMRVIIDFIMYIPCLLRDMVDYAKKDYANTPTTSFILLVVLIFYVILFFIFPEVQKEWSKGDGVTLLTRPVSLQEVSVSMNRNDLYDKIFYSKPFYERWTRQIVIYLEQKDRENQKAFAAKAAEVKAAAKEGFTTLETQDSQSLYGWYALIDHYRKYLFEDMKQDINPALNKKIAEWDQELQKNKKSFRKKSVIIPNS